VIRKENSSAISSLEHLVSAVLVVFDDKWATDTKASSNRNTSMGDHAITEFPDHRSLNPIVASSN